MKFFFFSYDFKTRKEGKYELMKQKKIGRKVIIWYKNTDNNNNSGYKKDEKGNE